MNQLPVATSQIQWFMIGISGILLIGVIFVVKMLWGVRAPAHTFLNAWAGTEEGQKAITSAMRDYLSKAEGKIFMEGVINGKVRKEVEEHNTGMSSHHSLQEKYATINALNGAMATIRSEQVGISTKTIEATCKMLEIKFDELGRGLRERDKDRDR